MSEITNNKLMVNQYKEFRINLGNRNFIEILQEIKFEKFQSNLKSICYVLHKVDEKLRFLKLITDSYKAERKFLQKLNLKLNNIVKQ